MSSNYTIATLTGNTSGTFTGIDYTSELGRIATALETIATNSGTTSYNLSRLVSVLAQNSTTCTGSISGTTLTVSGVGAKIKPGSEVISPPASAGAPIATIKPGTIITAQLTYTNTASASTNATVNSGDHKLIVKDTLGIRLGQYVAGAGAGTLSIVADTPTVVNINPATNVVVLSSPVAGDYTDVPQSTTTGTGEEATFDISLSGETYTVTLNAPGSGYKVGDDIRILGTDIEGISPDNDIVVKVLTETDGNIDTFSYTGNANRLYSFIAPGRDGTYTVSISQAVSSTAMVICDLSQGSIADIIQDNVFKTVDAYDILTPATLVSSLNSPSLDISLTNIFNNLPLSADAQFRKETIIDVLNQFNTRTGG